MKPVYCEQCRVVFVATPREVSYQFKATPSATELTTGTYLAAPCPVCKTEQNVKLLAPAQ